MDMGSFRNMKIQKAAGEGGWEGDSQDGGEPYAYP